jgi:predicted secreted Zn-dependent protease
VTTYEAAFFGPNTTVKTYRVFGSTPLEIVESMLARGPRNNWLNERAEAVTLAVPEIRVELVGSGSACHVVARANPAVSFRFTITLPRWEPPSAASRTTVTWWNAELGRAATHEHHHVDLWRAAGTRLSRAATTSTCANLQSRLAAIVKATARENCEFDMDEYGKALGLSLDDCLGG